MIKKTNYYAWREGDRDRALVVEQLTTALVFVDIKHK